MLRIHSFLQNLYSCMKFISKRMYRTCAIITTGTAVVAVIAFSSRGFGGSGKNHVTPSYLTMETESEYEEEEVEADTEAKIQIETVEETSEAKSTEESAAAKIESASLHLGSGIVTMAGEWETSAEKAEESEQKKKAYSGTEVTEYEYDILLHIVAAEAGGSDVMGQILVANVIMNRVEHETFPDTIEEVVFQKNQFSPVLAGTLWSTTVTDATREAVDRALAGEDYSQGALFFSARARLGDESMAWFDTNLQWLFEHGGHEFYTFK